MNDYYPYLFEAEDSESEISEKTGEGDLRLDTQSESAYRKYVGFSAKSKINLNTLGFINNVDNVKPSDTIDSPETFNEKFSTSAGKKRYLEYLVSSGEISQGDFDLYFAAKTPTKKLNVLKQYPFSNKLTFGDFWDHQIDLFKIESDGKEKSAPKVKQGASFESKKTEFGITDDIIEFYTINDKFDDFKNWIEKLPDGTLMSKPVYRIFEIADRIIKGKEEKISINSTVNFKLPADVQNLDKDKQQEWKNSMIENVAAFNKPEDINGPDGIYLTEVLRLGSFLNTLFSIDVKGVGKGELLMTYLLPGAKFAGGGDSFDLLTVDGKTFELKDYSSVDKKTKSNVPIRLGGGGKITRFPFYEKVAESIKLASKIHKELGDSGLKEFGDPYLAEIWAHVVSTKDYNKDPNAVKSAFVAGELKNARINILNMWYYLVHDLIARAQAGDMPNSESGNTDKGKYNTITLNGTGLPSKTILIDPISEEGVGELESVKLKKDSGFEKIMHELSGLEYIRKPENFKTDLDDTPQIYFDHIPEIDAFMVFRPDAVNIEGPAGFSYSKISQATIYLIETRYENHNHLTKAREDWKDEISQYNDEMYNKTKSKFEPIHSEAAETNEPDPVPIKEELNNEDFYPSLFS